MIESDALVWKTKEDFGIKNLLHWLKLLEWEKFPEKRSVKILLRSGLIIAWLAYLSAVLAHEVLYVSLYSCLQK